MRLRRILGDEHVVETRSDGYALRLRPDQLDLLRFRQLTRAAMEARDTGAPAAELDLLADALRCRRGAATGCGRSTRPLRPADDDLSRDLTITRFDDAAGRRGS